MNYMFYRKVSISNIILIIILLFYSFLFLLSDFSNISPSNNVIFSFVIIALICIVGLFADKNHFSLNKTFWLFNLFFLFLAPFFQYLNNFNEWNYILNDNDYFYSNLLIILSLLFYYLIYSFIPKSKEENHISFLQKTDKHTTILLVFVSIIVFVVLLSLVGFQNLLIRKANNISISDESFINNIILYFCRTVPALCFGYIFLLKNRKKVKVNFYSIKMTILFIIILLSNFPTSTTRFWMGTIFIGICLIVFKPKNRLYDLAFIGIFAVIFPIMFMFKYVDFYSFVTSNNSNFDNYNLTSIYNSVDYDAYSVLSRTIIYVNDYGIVHGGQLKGTLLFFIPRSIWHNKPFASGALIASKQGQWYTGISCPLIAEGYLNFGIIGSLVFMFVLALIVKKVDSVYWLLENEHYGEVTLFQLVYPFLMGLLIFILRGALHHGIVYLFMFLLAPILVRVLLLFRKGDNKC